MCTPCCRSEGYRLIDSDGLWERTEGCGKKRVAQVVGAVALQMLVLVGIGWLVFDLMGRITNPDDSEDHASGAVGGLARWKNGAEISVPAFMMLLAAVVDFLRCKKEEGKKLRVYPTFLSMMTTGLLVTGGSIQNNFYQGKLPEDSNFDDTMANPMYGLGALSFVFTAGHYYVDWKMHLTFREYSRERVRIAINEHGDA